MRFITTTLPYINSRPHMGHALELIQGDALTRFFNNLGPVHFNSGLDEHGIKVYRKAKELNLDTQAYCDIQAAEWVAFCQSANIMVDSFYRTSSKDHAEMVAKFWMECFNRGDLYKKQYVGKYCVGCESFKTETDLVDGKCPDHNTVPEPTSEENWFFRVSKYTDSLLYWLDNNKEFLTPYSKIEELRNIIVNAKDISVSRNKEAVHWGIPVPNDSTQVIYVWFEALLNYIFAAGDDWDSETIQICGPDNLRFQGHLFQAMLASAGMKHTDRLLVHGTVLDADGKKMSKSIGNVVDPLQQISKYGVDAVRYYALAGLTTCSDGNWSDADLINLYNTELADDFGNLLARVVHLTDTKQCASDVGPTDRSFTDQVDAMLDMAEESWKSLNIHKGIKETIQVLKLGNKYMNDKRPWSEPDYFQTLSNLYYLLYRVTRALYPVIPESCLRAEKSLDSKKKDIIFPKIK